MMNTPLAFGMPGGPEWVIIFLAVLLLFGAKKIPELARGIGKGMGEFKKAKKDFEDEIKAGEEQGKDEWEKKKSSFEDENDHSGSHPAAKED